MTRAFKYLLVFAVLGSAQTAFGQGCSDPGICTVGTLNSQNTKDSVSTIDYTIAGMDALMNAAVTHEMGRLELNSLYAQGEPGVSYITETFRAAFRIKEKLMINFKIPYTFVQGTLGNVSGLGDFTVSLQNDIYSGKGKRLAYTMGLVIPSGRADKSSGGFALPMAYQTTLGSFNALVGLSGAIHNWGMAIGYQQSFGENGNEFTHEALDFNPASADYDPLNPTRRTLPSAYRLRRGNDIVMRVERKFAIKKLELFAGVLPIFRLNESTRGTLSGGRETIDGTDGITLNITAAIKYAPNKNWLFRINGGVPAVQRQVRADGLTRTFVGIVTVAYRVW